MEAKIEIWKSRLLDLGKRNRLLNYKETKRSNIKIVEPNLEEVFKKLVNQEKCLKFPHPINEFIDNGGVEQSLGFSEGDIKTNRALNEQQKTLLSIRSKARTAIQEQGTNILYLSFGFLSWKESTNSDINIKSPLLLVPVTLTIQSVTEPYMLHLHEDEIVVNPTLKYKLENDFGVLLPSFEEYEDDILGYLKLINTISKKNNWEVIHEVDLSLLSFLKLNMYNDLENNIDKIKSHPVLNGLSGDSNSISKVSDEYENYDHDYKTKSIDMFQVLDADSSQQDAILYSKKNISYVLQGPPGTGKSQTITNIISEALADGKKVLFVSEKMAALEVVYKRLTQVGLAEFCLPLHSHKTKKKDVLNDLNSTLNMNKVKIKDESLYILQSLEDNKKKLNSYIKELHTKNFPLNKSIYEVNGILANLSKSKDIIFAVDKIDEVTNDNLYRYRILLEEFGRSIGNMKEDYKANPWVDCNVSSVSHELRHDIETNLNVIIPNLVELQHKMSVISNDLEWDIKPSINNIHEMIEIMDFLEQAPNIPIDWIYRSEIYPMIKRANEYSGLLTEYKTIYNGLNKQYEIEFFNVSARQVLEDLKNLTFVILDKSNKSKYNKVDYIIENFDFIVDNLSIISEKLVAAKKNVDILTKMYGFGESKNVDQLYAINETLKNILKNPKPTETWFDDSKELIVLNLFEKVRNVYNKIELIEKEIMIEFDKQILKLDYAPILSRFRTEYSNFFKIFKSMYQKDKKNIKSFALNADHVLDDKKMVDLLNKLREIEEEKTWLNDNDAIIEHTFGSHYLKEYTDWELLGNSLRVFKNIKNVLQEKINYESMKRLLLSGVNSDEEIIRTSNKINEVINNSITDKIEAILDLNDNVMLIDIEDIYVSSINLIDKISRFKDVYSSIRSCTREKYSYDKYIKDLENLDRIQDIEEILKVHSNQLKQEFLFRYEGIDTDWDSIINSLTWTNEFIMILSKHRFSDKIMKKICNEKEFLKEINIAKISLKDNINVFKYEWEWFNDLFEDTACLTELTLDKLIGKIEKCSNRLSSLEEWIDFRSCRENCYKEGIGEYIEKAEENKMHRNQLVDGFFKRFYRLWLDAIIPKYPTISSFRGRLQDEVISEFVKLDIAQLAIARSRIRERLLAKLPDLNKSTFALDEVGILRREIGKQRKIMPLRKLFKVIPNLLLSLKPCLMMSPISVSLFLQADAYDFDLVIFDEASQVCTEDAVGAIMRGKQVIIVGDNKQLPPTSFFRATLSDGDFDIDTEDESDDSDGFESILDEALTVLTERTLKWHYRSKHEHLIAFSNAKIYKHSLVTFPTSYQKVIDTGVEYIYVSDGIYDRGGKKDNINEAKKVAYLVFEHIQKYPNRSLGIVTFSGSQQQAIEAAIRQLRLQNQQYEIFFNEDKEESFFVKNLENVQGDERDTIIFSIGYAKDHNGIMYMNFGPLSRNGGFRRLNVAITRAKYNVKLVGSIHPTDINIDKTNSEGVKMLRSYIDFAIHGESVLANELKYNNIVDVESPFEEAVYNFLSDNGHSVVTQVGCSGYRIDLAVKHPKLSGIFVLGVECDGATYHSARTARERDRIRQTVLEDIGWKIYRIWSTDWIKDPKTEGDRLLKHIEVCINSYVEEDLSSGRRFEENMEINSITEDLSIIEDTIVIDPIDNKNPYGFQYYVESNISEVKRCSNDRKYLMDLITHVVKTESPIHFELLCKRLVPAFGRTKVTSVVKESIQNISNLITDEIIIKENFYWTKLDDKLIVRILEDGDTSRTINHICFEEIAECMYIISKNSFGINKENLIIVTARTFGFNRVGKNITDAIETAYNYLLSQNRIKIVDEKIIVEEDSSIESKQLMKRDIQ